MNHSQTGVGGNPVNFARVDSSGTSNAWSTLHGMGFEDDEIKLAIVKASTNGWTQGDIAQIDNPFGTGRLLEGVVTVPNDPVKYGPWAGKILTCAEAAGVIAAIDTGGTVTLYNLGLHQPKDVRLIPAGQNLYALDFNTSQVLKVTQDNFASFAGDILLVEEKSDPAGCAAPGVYIVHWEGGRFVVRFIFINALLEHVTFAPIDIPALP